VGRVIGLPRVGLQGAEQGQDPVADELRHVAPVRGDRPTPTAGGRPARDRRDWPARGGRGCGRAAGAA
jgi:hypothetical protein